MSTKERDSQVPEGQREDRKQQVLTHGSASVVQSISDAVVAKDGEPFFLCPPDGQVPCDDGHGFGLYHHDCRFLNGYELTLAGTKPNSLAATEAEGSRLVLELTNDEIHDAKHHIAKEQLGVTWARRVDGQTPALDDQIDIRNYGRSPVEADLELRFRAGFEDVFDIRGLLNERPGRLRDPSWSDGRLEFAYEGADGINRLVRLSFDPAPARHHGERVAFELELSGRGRTSIRVTAEMVEQTRGDATPIERRDSPPEASDRSQARDGSPRPAHEWIGGGTWPTSVRTTSLVLGTALSRSLADLQLLRSRLDSHRYYEAGIPWFGTLFGRDSLISALQSLAFDPSLAPETLRLLAGRQGDEVNDWRDEEPGKILHELRIGELARLGEIPHTPYYGTVDATPLFLILLGEHARWTGRLDLFDELHDAVDGALTWLDRYADSDGDGFVDYNSSTKRGLINQGWKDSGNGIVNADGDIAQPPIALVEVQGYAYRAWRLMAELFERSGNHDRAADLRRRAAAMRERFEARYWSDELDAYILALADGQPCEVLTSNAGQTLWTGIARPDHAERVVRRLMRPDMFNGWGIRTLSADAAAYRPIGYHLGTVWPHDNSLIAAGFRRYGHAQEAEAIFVAMLEAAQNFPHSRLPECFAGYSRSEYGSPVRYPVACHPQAWAAGSIPQLLVSCLGLVPEAFDRRLRIVNALLPTPIEALEMRGLAVGDARAHLRFERRGDATRVDVLGVEGELDVVIGEHGHADPEAEEGDAGDGRKSADARPIVSEPGR